MGNKPLYQSFLPNNQYWCAINLMQKRIYTKLSLLNDPINNVKSHVFYWNVFLWILLGWLLKHCKGLNNVFDGIGMK